MKTLLVAILLVGWVGLSVKADNTTTKTPADNSKTTANATSGGGSGDSNVTTASPEPTTASTTTMTTAKPTSGPTPTPVDVSSRPVSSQCLTKYKDCKKSAAPSPANPPSYCATLSKSMDCINGTSVNGSCDARETFVLDLLDCGPSTFFSNSSVGASCRDRISECLSQTQAAKDLKVGDDFKAFFCRAISDGSCLDTKSTTPATCTKEEKLVAMKYATCSAPQALFSSALVISLAIVLQRLLKGY